MFIHEGAVQKVLFRNANANQSELPQEYSDRYMTYIMVASTNFIFYQFQTVPPRAPVTYASNNKHCYINVTTTEGYCLVT